jgi:hypothetical protein
LRSRHLIISARSLYLANQLTHVRGLLEQSGVTVIAFKGPTLAALAYREPGLREFSDLDLLVPFFEFPAARQTLIPHGYRPRCANARVLTSAVFQCYEDTLPRVTPWRCSTSIGAPSPATSISPIPLYCGPAHSASN